MIGHFFTLKTASFEGIVKSGGMARVGRFSYNGASPIIGFEVEGWGASVTPKHKRFTLADVLIFDTDT